MLGSVLTVLWCWDVYLLCGAGIYTDFYLVLGYVLTVLWCWNMCWVFFSTVICANCPLTGICADHSLELGDVLTFLWCMDMCLLSSVAKICANCPLVLRYVCAVSWCWDLC